MKNFEAVFRFTKIYEKSKSAINKHEPWGVFATQALEGIQRDLTAFISSNYGQFIYDVSNSQGAPSMPRIPWVAITASRTRVSMAPSYAICFGRKGDGFVHGLMLPATINFTQLTPQIRTENVNYINIDGTKRELKYNNRFINPIEVLPTEINDQKIFNHIQKSLEILNSIELKKA